MTVSGIVLERFLLDESGLHLGVLGQEDIETELQGIVDLLDYVAGAHECVTKWSEIWAVEVAPGQTVSDLLFTPSGVDPDLRRLLGGRLQRLHDWDRNTAVQPDMDIVCNGEPLSIAPTIGLAALLAREGRHVACLTTRRANRSGASPISTPTGHVPVDVFFVSSASDATAYWRYLMSAEDYSKDELAGLSSLAFPNLRFAGAVWGQVGNFEGSYRDIRAALLKHLSGLNDHALTVWREHVEPDRIATEMGSRAGVDCSLDSPKTHRNAAAMAQRRIEVDGATVLCEWHTKLERHRNRIHFAVTENAVVIGRFADHLDT